MRHARGSQVAQSKGVPAFLWDLKARGQCLPPIQELHHRPVGVLALAVWDDEAVLLEERIRRLASLLVPLQVPVVLLLGHRCVVIAARVPVDPPRIHVVRQLVNEELKLLLFLQQDH